MLSTPTEEEVQLIPQETSETKKVDSMSARQIIAQVVWVIWWLIIYGLSLLMVLNFSIKDKRFVPNNGKPNPNDVGENYTIKKAYFGLLLHMIGGILAIFIGPIQFQQFIRKKQILVHKVFGYVYYTGTVVGFVGACWLVPFATGGMTNHFAFGMLALVWIICNGMAFYYIKFGFGMARERRISLHREWMIRSYAATAASITLRLWLIALILFGSLVLKYDDHTSFIEAYRSSSWLGPVPNLVVAEIYIRLTANNNNSSEEEKQE